MGFSLGINLKLFFFLEKPVIGKCVLKEGKEKLENWANLIEI